MQKNKGGGGGNCPTRHGDIGAWRLCKKKRGGGLKFISPILKHVLPVDKILELFLIAMIVTMVI